MIVEVRKTISGTEYWDTKEKRSLFVSTGEEPGFEVTTKKEELYKTEVLGEMIGPDLEDMTVKELRDHAASINVEIPADVKKKEDIIKLLS